MGGLNATSSLCGVWEVVNYFFASKVETSGLVSRVAVLATRAFDALDIDFKTLAICPVRPQNIYNLLSKWCLCSVVVSLPSLPNFDEMSGLEEPELVEVLAAFPEDSLSLEALELLLPEGAEAEGLLKDGLEELEGFACLLSLDLCSQ